MTDTQTQTAVNDADDPEKQGAEGQDAQGKGDDLDEILDEIAAESTTDDASKDDADKDKTKGDSPDVSSNFARDYYQREARRDLKTAIATMKSDNETLAGLDPDYIESLMNAEARKDPRILQAFKARDENPAGWERVLPVLGKKIAKGLGGTVDRQATEDRAAVLASVRNKSPGQGGGGGSVDLNAMSDAEFEAHKKTLAKAR